MVRWNDSCTPVKHVYTTYVEMTWIFFTSVYTQIKATHKILGFSVYFFIIIFFSMLNNQVVSALIYRDVMHAEMERLSKWTVARAACRMYSIHPTWVVLTDNNSRSKQKLAQ